MAKLVGIGLWVVAVALAAVYFSVQMALTPKVDKALADRIANEQTIRGDLTSMPVIDKGEVTGYFLIKLSYVVDKVKLATVKIPVDVMITDQLYTLLVGNKAINLENRSAFDVEAFRKAIREALNKRLGDEVVHDVMVEQLDFLSQKSLQTSLKDKKMNITGGQPIVKDDKIVEKSAAEEKPGEVPEGETAKEPAAAEGH